MEALAQKRKEGLDGRDKLTILMNALNKDTKEAILKMLDEQEVRQISQLMVTTRVYDQDEMEHVLQDFSTQLMLHPSLVDPFESTEDVLSKLIDEDRVKAIMEEIRNPTDRSMWDKLASINEDILATYLKTEYPQAVAVILSKLKPEQAARVMLLLPEDFAADVLLRMLQMDNIKREVILDIERTLRTEFANAFSSNAKSDMLAVIAEIFNRLERTAESKFIQVIENVNPDAAERIRDLMFTFEDLKRLSSESIRTLLRYIDRSKLSLALKGTPDELKDVFFNNMPERASRLLKEAIVDLGAVRLRDVEEAQATIVAKAKEIAAQGEIDLTSHDDDELVY